MTQFERLQFLTDLLLKEYPSDMLQKNPDNEQELFQVYRSLVNVRQPKKAPDGFLEVERGDCTRHFNAHAQGFTREFLPQLHPARREKRL